MGPMALLPNLNGQYSLVWTGPTDEITRLKQLNNSEFLIALQQQFGDRVGNFKLFEKRVTFPLKQSFVSKYPESNIAIIGNSAQIMHPVAGQGLNTGVRDALILADCINKNVNLDFKLMINKFNHMRKKETKDTLRFTESLVILFSNDFIGVNKIRGMALSFLDLIPPIRKSFVRKMSYGK
jgi:2-octaprenyl-6-methoxyphenol hydroxylase